MTCKVFVVSAHIGDEILGCGGTLALHRRRGDEVRVLVLGEGWTSRTKSVEKGLEAVDMEAFEKQGRQALEVLGVKHVNFQRLPDNRFDSLPLLDIVKIVEAAKYCYEPDIVYTNTSHDLGVDQQMTCRAVVTAFRPLPDEKHIELYVFEVRSSTEWDYSESSRVFVPNCFVNVEDTLETKLGAFQCLRTEVRPWPHSRSLTAIEHNTRARGASVGLGAAEAFVLLRAVKDIA